MPFGEEHEISGNLKNKNRFIGKEKDEETDLYYFGARYLDARTGRFIKPDPVGIREADLLNPQRLNRYSYSLNNPYRYVDPDGEVVIPLVILGAIYDILTSPSIGETPYNANDVHEDTSTVDLVVNTTIGTTVLITAASEGLSAAGKKIVEEVTGVSTTPSKNTSKFSKAQKSKKVKKIGDGKFTKTTEVRPGKGPGQSRAEYIRYKNAEGKTIRTYKDSYDRANKFQGRKPLRGGPEGRLQ
jgi:RHS repeat-associated protein